MNILAINIGNSRTATGWFSKGKIRRSARSETVSPVILEAVANDESPDGIMLGSVAPGRNVAWARLVKKIFPKVPVLWMEPRLDFGIGVDLKRPDQTGHDRFADAVAGAELCGVPCIVCDFGTAATFNLVLPKRGFSGGVIAPGYGMWFAAMSGSTAQQGDSLAGVSSGADSDDAAGDTPADFEYAAGRQQKAGCAARNVAGFGDGFGG